MGEGATMHAGRPRSRDASGALFLFHRWRRSARTARVGMHSRYRAMGLPAAGDRVLLLLLLAFGFSHGERPEPRIDAPCAFCLPPCAFFFRSRGKLTTLGQRARHAERGFLTASAPPLARSTWSEPIDGRQVGCARARPSLRLSFGSVAFGPIRWGMPRNHSCCSGQFGSHENVSTRR